MRGDALVFWDAMIFVTTLQDDSKDSSSMRGDALVFWDDMIFVTTLQDDYKR
jgi:hypothetical protein